jgi:hypothetical protein
VHTERNVIAKNLQNYALLTQVALRSHVGGNGGRNLRERGRSAWKARNLDGSTNAALTQICSVWTGSTAGAMWTFIEGSRTKAQVPTNEEKF